MWRSLGVFHKQGPGLVTAEVAGYAKRHARFGPLERGARTGGTGFKIGEFFLEKGVHGIHPLPRGRSIVNGARNGRVRLFPEGKATSGIRRRRRL